MHVPYPGEPRLAVHDHDWADGHCQDPDCAAVLPAKVLPILVYAFHTTDEGGGFDWCPDNPDNRAVLRTTLVSDLTHRNYETGTLVSLTLKDVPEDWSEITDFLEGEWQDAIEVASVGHVIARFYTTTT